MAQHGFLGEGGFPQDRTAHGRPGGRFIRHRAPFFRGAIRQGRRCAIATRVLISRKATTAILGGHPWFYREGTTLPAVGEVVELTSDRKIVAWGLADVGTVAARVLGIGRAPGDVVSWIGLRIAEADTLRRDLVDPGTDAMRVVSSAGDGLPDLVVDRYADLAVIRLYSRSWERWLDAIVAAVAALPWCRSVTRRLGVQRVDDSDGLVVLSGPAPPDLMIVSEGRIRLPVRPYVGQKTGLFLDQREHRALVGRWARGRRVVNLFAYNGGFSVAAALGGARRVVTVDLAPDAVADAREAFRINDLNPDDHGFEVADAFLFEPPRATDFVVCDPPALTRGARSDEAASNAYTRLHRRLGPFIPPHGLLATSSCTARLDLDAWKRLVAEGLSPAGPWSWHHVSAEPPDHPVALGHPEGHYLKFALLRRRSSA